MEHLTKKYGASAVARYGKPGNPLDVAGIKVGISFNSSRRVIQTTSCHRVMEWIRSNKSMERKQDEVMCMMFADYFERGLDLSDVNNLVTCISKIPGISKTDALQMLNETDNYTAEVLAQDDTFKKGGVNGVPYFIIGSGGRKVQFSGAQPPEVFVEVFEDLIS